MLMNFNSTKMLTWILVLSTVLVSINSQKADPSDKEVCENLCSCEERDGLLHINCQSRDITEISQIKPPQTCTYNLNLQENFVTRLYRDGFLNFKNALSLHLGKNNLQDLEAGIFTGLSSLKRLHINGNYLEVLREGTFRGLEYLEFLQADNNLIHIIEPGAFSKLHRLKVLILNDNAISFLPTNIFRFVPLTHLDLRGNQLDSLPYVGLLEHIGRIMELQLEDNPWKCDCDLLPLRSWLENMPPQSNIGNVVCMHPLRLKGKVLIKTSITEICPMGSGTDFEEPINSIHLVVTPAADNTHINIHNANKSVIKEPEKDPFIPLPDGQDDGKIPVSKPGSHPKSPCTTTCHCSTQPNVGQIMKCQGRNIKSLMDLVPSPPNPIKLYLTDNIIQSVTKYDLLEYGSLDLLHLGNNRITLIEDGAFANLTNLHKIYLNGNGIVRLTKEMFIGLQCLQYLYLEHNTIKEILPGTFSVLPQLKVLYLNNNLLHSFPPYIFSGVPLLRLNLKHNHFMHLPVSNVIDQLEFLVQIDLEDNPWDCTCDLVSLKQWMEKLSKNVTVSEIMCESPEKFAKKDLKMLNNELICPGLINDLVAPTQSNDINLVTVATSTASSLLNSIMDTVPLSVLILSMLAVFILIVFSAAGIVVLVLHRRRRSKKKQKTTPVQDCSPLHVQYSVYGHKRTHHTEERPDGNVYEQHTINSIGPVCRSRPYNIRDVELENENKDGIEPKMIYRSHMMREKNSMLTGSKFGVMEQTPEFIPLCDPGSMYRNMLEKERELQQIGITEYLKKNIPPLQSELDVRYPSRHEELKLMEAIMYSRPKKVVVEETKNEYFELKAKLQAEPDYLEVLEQQTALNQP
ncbi:SLIT and NTRK-like protein 6 [Stegostoma tigrinum]|uniref:SLIT and NTRK-like protein 6 n=1 Tax=Stegostoma tigrinum TaxID=3053191 RepID=UPI00202B33AC|nr:SLIT and NTRK-like protein 6 [Stegostoma tigrinum]XP_048388589.1 SLIT and NTRK-like protein 6 [Stegostoma tigrinum]XP_048388590.1 SLIT and NTRK-like protein 6 [Stegostoma tigrinum]